MIEKITNDYLEFKKQITQSEIRSNMKSLKISYALFILNAGLAIWNGFNIYFGYCHLQWWCGCALGFSSLSTIWMLLIIWEIMLNVKMDKEYLSIMEESFDKYFIGVNNDNKIR
jgi:hypothetical protein